MFGGSRNGFITEYLDVPRYSIYAERFNEKIDNPLKISLTAFHQT